MNVSGVFLETGGGECPGAAPERMVHFWPETEGGITVADGAGESHSAARDSGGGVKGQTETEGPNLL